MKSLLIALTIVSAPVLAQSNYYENRFNNPVIVQQANQPNGYYYNKNTNTYSKPKNINRDLYGYTPQGSLSYSYDTNRYAPKNLRIN